MWTSTPTISIDHYPSPPTARQVMWPSPDDHAVAAAHKGEAALRFVRRRITKSTAVPPWDNHLERDHSRSQESGFAHLASGDFIRAASAPSYHRPVDESRCR